MLTEPRLAVLLVVGLLAVTNGLWLFPHDGDVRYTYERSAITVENGTFDYRGDDVFRFHYENDLVDVGCQPGTDGVGRACAFDQFLAEHGPVTIAADGALGVPTFVELGGAYYRRVATKNGSGTTYDVERVAPRAVLAVTATNISGVDPDDVDPGFSIPVRVAVTGEPARTFDRVEADRLGQIYRRGDEYYTVVLTAETTVEQPLVSEGLRRVLQVVGLGLLLGAAVVAFPRVEDPVERLGRP